MDGAVQNMVVTRWYDVQWEERGGRKERGGEGIYCPNGPVTISIDPRFPASLALYCRNSYGDSN